MRVAVVGAGALGRVFAAALHYAGVEVTLVGRRESAESTEFTVCRRGLGQARRKLVLPVVTTLPVAELYVLAVRGEQLEEPQANALLAQLNETHMPVLMLSPVLLEGAVRVRTLLPEVILSMPTIACHWHPEQQALEYWCSRLAPTQIEPSQRTPGASEALVRLLRRGGIPARVTPGVALSGVATTIAFFPLQVAVVAGGRISEWPAAPGLLAQIGDALREASLVARRIGKVEPGIRVLVLLASFPGLLRLGCYLVPRVQPALVRFLEYHFGPKLLSQHRLFTAQITELGHKHGCPTHHLNQLMARADRRALNEPPQPINSGS